VNHADKGALAAWRKRWADVMEEFLKNRKRVGDDDSDDDHDARDGRCNSDGDGEGGAGTPMTEETEARTRIVAQQLHDDLTAIAETAAAVDVEPGVIAVRQLGERIDAGLARSGGFKDALSANAGRCVVAGTHGEVKAALSVLKQSLADVQHRDAVGPSDNVAVKVAEHRGAQHFWDDVVATEVEEVPDSRLNREQQAAFVAVVTATNRLLRYDTHVVEYAAAQESATAAGIPSPPQRPVAPKIFITGGAGVGKTFYLNALRERLGRKRVVVSASTGAAASLIPGATTVHNLLELPVCEKTPSAERQMQMASAGVSEKKAARIRRRIPPGCYVIAIDEWSMVSTSMLISIDATLRAVRQSAEPFGGMIVLAFGDVLQLPAIGGALTLAAVNGDAKTGGVAAALFKSFCVLEFMQQMRVQDTRHAAIVERFRTHMEAPVDDKTLRALMPLTAADVCANAEWGLATAVFPKNYERCVFNIQAMTRYGRTTGQPLIAWRLELVVNSTAVLQAFGHGRRGGDSSDAASVVANAAVRESETARGRSTASARVPVRSLGAAIVDLWYSEAACPGATVLFAVGAPALLTENINPARGLANGSEVVLHSLTVDEADRDALQERIARAVPGEIILLERPPLAVNVHVKCLAPKYNSDGTVREPTPSWARELDLRRRHRDDTGMDSESSGGSDDDAGGTPVRVASNVAPGEKDLGPVFSVPPLCSSMRENASLNAGPGFRKKLAAYGVDSVAAAVIPAFGRTYHKIQGGTLDHVILALTAAKKGDKALVTAASLYVGMSRVRDGSRLRTLPADVNPHRDFRHLKALSFPLHIRQWRMALVPVQTPGSSADSPPFRMLSQFKLDNMHVVAAATARGKKPRRDTKVPVKAAPARKKARQESNAPTVSPAAASTVTPSAPVGILRRTAAVSAPAVGSQPGALVRAVRFALDDATVTPACGAAVRRGVRAIESTPTPPLLRPPALGPESGRGRGRGRGATAGSDGHALVKRAPRQDAPAHAAPLAQVPGITAVTDSRRRSIDFTALLRVLQNTGRVVRTDDCGLANPSNYCFVIAALQMLRMVPAITTAVLRADVAEVVAGNVAATSSAAAAFLSGEWRRMLTELQRRCDSDEPCSEYRTADLIAQLHRAACFRDFAPHKQADSIEFLALTLDMVCTLLECPGPGANINACLLDGVQSAVWGCESTVSRCGECGYAWHSPGASFSTLQLEVSAGADGRCTLDSCIQNYLLEERLSPLTECPNRACPANPRRKARSKYEAALQRGDGGAAAAMVPTPPELDPASSVVTQQHLNATGSHLIVFIKRFRSSPVAPFATQKIATPVHIDSVVRLPVTVVPGDSASTVLRDFRVIGSIVSG
jgi:hypothetical protein